MEYGIGISGLDVAQRAIELIGTNIANASTEGYHRQELRTAPEELRGYQKVSIGGVQIVEDRRIIDRLLEQEIMRGQVDYGQVWRELTSLQSIEGALGAMDSEGLGTALSKFFGSLRYLSAQPNSQALQEQVVWAADTLAGQFRNLAMFLDDVDKQVVLEAQNVVEKVNGLSAQVAKLNDEILSAQARGGAGNLLLDQRDQAVQELSQLVAASAERQDADASLMTVSAWGTPLAVNNKSTELEIGYDEQGKLGLSVKGAEFYLSGVQGGQLGGLLALKNQILPGIRGKLDALAEQVITRINRYHFSGVGTAGSFENLTGTTSGDPAAALSTWTSGVTDGTFHVRVVSPAGQATLYAVSVDADADTLNSIVGKINALDPSHLMAGVVNSCLHLEGFSGYKFDFLPVLTTDTSSWTGPQPAVSGVFSGSQNQTYTCTAQGTGDVGVTDDLIVKVTDAGGNLVRTLNVGKGYAAGDNLELVDGIRLAFGTGTLTVGKSFTIQALAEGDTSGFLPTVGMNTLFSGDDAASMALRSDVRSRPARLAASLGEQMADNANASRMAALGEQRLGDLDDLSPMEYYRRLVAGIGQDVQVRKAKAASLESVALQLANQRDRVSGVDINEEAAKLMTFQQMFQAMAKFIMAQDRAMDTLLELVQ